MDFRIGNLQGVVDLFGDAETNDKIVIEKMKVDFNRRKQIKIQIKK